MLERRCIYIILWKRWRARPACWLHQGLWSQPSKHNDSIRDLLARSSTGSFLYRPRSSLFSSLSLFYFPFFPFPGFSYSFQQGNPARWITQRGSSTESFVSPPLQDYVQRDVERERERERASIRRVSMPRNDLRKKTRFTYSRKAFRPENHRIVCYLTWRWKKTKKRKNDLVVFTTETSSRRFRIKISIRFSFSWAACSSFWKKNMIEKKALWFEGETVRRGS